MSKVITADLINNYIIGEMAEQSYYKIAEDLGLFLIDSALDAKNGETFAFGYKYLVNRASPDLEKKFFIKRIDEGSIFMVNRTIPLSDFIPIGESEKAAITSLNNVLRYINHDREVIKKQFNADNYEIPSLEGLNFAIETIGFEVDSVIYKMITEKER